jgi:hypothetical protein
MLVMWRLIVYSGLVDRSLLFLSVWSDKSVLCLQAGPMVPESQREKLWRNFIADPPNWWDGRPEYIN